MLLPVQIAAQIDMFRFPELFTFVRRDHGLGNENEGSAPVALNAIASKRLFVTMLAGIVAGFMEDAKLVVVNAPVTNEGVVTAYSL